MQVLMLKPVASLGNPGELVNVKPGYARNFLVPNGLALVATPRNVKQFEHQKRQAEAGRLKFIEELRSVAEKIQGSRLEFVAKVGPQGKLFGSITAKMIADQLSEKLGQTVDHRKVLLEKPIRETGDYIIELRLDADVSGRVRIHVEGEVVEESAADASDTAPAGGE